jgi:pyrroloquinoline quinone biosynthesis protein B
MVKYTFSIFLIILSLTLRAQPQSAFVQVLGVTQDGGYPHMGCEKNCCAPAWTDPAKGRYVVSLALVDPVSKKWWLFEVTPDIKYQLHYFHTLTKGAYNYLPEGIFVTHAHIGHYAGLMQLGREVMNTKDEPVYALPRMQDYLEKNGPWSQLVKLKNIDIQPLQADKPVQLTANISVTPFTVPHRDEYSETAGFTISTSTTKYLFIPDVNKWDKWSRNIVEEVQKVDIAFLDATFYDDGELPTRNMKEILHPLVTETIAAFDKADKATKAKIHFIHMNHTNPMLWDKAKQKEITGKGYHIAEQGQVL